MVSEKQLIANRENGKLGGVKTEEGKKAVRFNAVTHGLLSKEVLLPWEDTTAHEILYQNLMIEFCPQGELETILIDRIVSSIWRLKRVLKVEAVELTNQCNASPTNSLLGSYLHYLPTVNRYEITIERQLYKAMHELERLQDKRSGKNVVAPLAVDVDIQSGT